MKTKEQSKKKGGFLHDEVLLELLVEFCLPATRICFSFFSCCTTEVETFRVRATSSGGLSASHCCSEKSSNLTSSPKLGPRKISTKTKGSSPMFWM